MASSVGIIFVPPPPTDFLFVRSRLTVGVTRFEKKTHNWMEIMTSEMKSVGDCSITLTAPHYSIA